GSHAGPSAIDHRITRMSGYAFVRDLESGGQALAFESLIDLDLLLHATRHRFARHRARLRGARAGE
ncbi:MAG TPA: hypothetical protein VHM25_21605, partial [Polyangiaceae bacterium]|nr:hypothetical protein [Polyangiaceae bacterium]